MKKLTAVLLSVLFAFGQMPVYSQGFFDFLGNDYDNYDDYDDLYDDVVDNLDEGMNGGRRFRYNVG